MDISSSDTNSISQIKYTFCNKCGESNKSEAVFCSSCGQALQQERVPSLTNTISQLENRVASLEGNEDPSENQLLSQTRFTLAVAYLRKEEIKKAIAQLRAVIALDNTNAYAHAYLGAALLEEYQVEEAKAELEQALELNPNDAVIQLKMGEFNLKLGLINPALTHFEAAFKLPAPSPESAHYIRTMLLKARKMNKKVIERPNRVVTLKIPVLSKWWSKKHRAETANFDDLVVPETQPIS